MNLLFVYFAYFLTAGVQDFIESYRTNENINCEYDSNNDLVITVNEGTSKKYHFQGEESFQVSRELCAPVSECLDPGFVRRLSALYSCKSSLAFGACAGISAAVAHRTTQAVLGQVARRRYNELMELENRLKKLEKERFIGGRDNAIAERQKKVDRLSSLIDIKQTANNGLIAEMGGRQYLDQFNELTERINNTQIFQGAQRAAIVNKYREEAGTLADSILEEDRNLKQVLAALDKVSEEKISQFKSQRDSLPLSEDQNPIEMKRNIRQYNANLAFIEQAKRDIDLAKKELGHLNGLTLEKHLKSRTKAGFPFKNLWTIDVDASDPRVAQWKRLSEKFSYMTSPEFQMRGKQKILNISNRALAKLPSSKLATLGFVTGAAANAALAALSVSETSCDDDIVDKRFINKDCQKEIYELNAGVAQFLALDPIQQRDELSKNWTLCQYYQRFFQKVSATPTIQEPLCLGKGEISLSMDNPRGTLSLKVETNPINSKIKKILLKGPTVSEPVVLHFVEGEDHLGNLAFIQLPGQSTKFSPEAIDRISLDPRYRSLIEAYGQLKMIYPEIKNCSPESLAAFVSESQQRAEKQTDSQNK